MWRYFRARLWRHRVAGEGKLEGRFFLRFFEFLNRRKEEKRKGLDFGYEGGFLVRGEEKVFIFFKMAHCLAL